MSISINPLDGNGGFGALVEGDATLTSGGIEGSLGIGGDMTLGGGVYEITANNPGTFVVPGDSAPTGLLVGGAFGVGGSAPGGLARVLGNTYTHLGDMTGVQQRNTDDNGAIVATHVVATGAGYNSTPGIELTTTQPTAVGPVRAFGFPSAFTAFRERSDAMAQCPATLTPPEVTLVSGQTNVMNITGDELNALSELTFRTEPTAAAPLLINVQTGSSFDWESTNMAGIGPAHGQYILWNFPNATTLRHVSGDSIIGGVYAPRAQFTDIDQANIAGSIVVAELVHDGGRLIYQPFNAIIECGPTPPPPTATPTVTPTVTPVRTASAGPARGPEPLPVTGGDISGVLLAGALLMSVGFGLHQLARRLRDRA